MSADLESRRFHVRLVTGGATAAAATYGAGTFGDADLTYGQEQGESAYLGVEYHVLPVGAWHPAQPGWTFRKGDTLRPFGLIVVNGDDPTERLDLDAVTSARVAIRQLGFGITPNVQTFDLSLNTTDDIFERTWLPDDLDVPGTYQLSLEITFDTGRIRTLEPNDTVLFKIEDAP